MKSVIAENLVKTYNKGEVRALDGLSLEVEEGTVLSVLGPNGAGKSTTLEIMETLRPKTSGTVMIDGLDLDKEPNAIKKNNWCTTTGFRLLSRIEFTGIN